jgi:hypothetical protein
MATEMMGGEVLEQVRLTTRELAAVCRVDKQRIRDWVTRGHIRPAVWGTTAPGSGHLWTVKQALGLTIACHHWWEERGHNPPWDLLIDEYRRVLAWDWDAVAHCLMVRSDMHSEEAWAKAMWPVPRPDWLPRDDREFEDLPEGERVNILRLARRLSHLGGIVWEKLTYRRGRRSRARGRV